MNEIVKKNGISFGLISGLISVVITTLIYVINLEYFTKWWIGVVTILISIILSIMLMITTKKQLKEDFPFKSAFTTYFIYTLIGTSIGVIFNIILFNLIDPAAKDTLRELTTKFTIEMMEKFGAPREAINEALKGIKTQDQFGISSQIKGLFFTIAFSCIWGLILSAIFKSEKRQF